ncbi:MAG TPA: prepilin peptidase [Telluria sp.]|jgi:prepilin peptidase CpaA
MLSVQTVLEIVLLMMVTAAAMTDLARRRIPNILLLAGWVAALPLHLLSIQPGSALLGGLAGALCGLLVFLPLYLLRGMAAGDVKLMATVGLFVGPLEALQVAVIACCVGGAMAFAIILYTGRLGHAFSNVGDLLRPLWMRALGMPAVAEPMRHPSVGNMPYGLAIAVATIVLLYMHHA